MSWIAVGIAVLMALGEGTEGSEAMEGGAQVQPPPGPPGQYPPGQYPWYPPPPGYPPPAYPGYPPPPVQPLPVPVPSSSEPSSEPVPAAALQAQTAENKPVPPSRASWSLQLESAQGVATGKFANTLLAGHIDYAFASRLSLGGYLALANLKGKDKRVNALLPCALVTYEKPPGPGGSVSFPIQFASGYLTRNGPVAKLAAGLAWAVGRRTDVIASLATMAWVTRDQMLLSLNLSLELRFRSGTD